MMKEEKLWGNGGEGVLENEGGPSREVEGVILIIVKGLTWT